MKLYELIAYAEWRIGNKYQSLGKRFKDMPQSVWEQIKHGAVIKEIPKKLLEKIKKMKSKDVCDEGVKPYTNYNESAREVANDLMKKFDERLSRGRVSQKDD